MQKLINFIQNLQDFIGKSISWLTTALVLVVAFDVCRRYLFNKTSVAFLELEWYIFSLIFLLGMGYALRHDEHVRVDVFYTRFSEVQKAWVNLLGTIFFLMPLCILVIYHSITFVKVSYFLGENSANPNGLSYTFLIKLAIPIGFLLLILQAIALVMSCCLVILKKKISTQPPKGK